MEKFHLEHDIKVFCTTATSFPHGVQDAFTRLEKMLNKENRNFYGISYLDANGNIIYKAAVSEQFEGEAKQLGFERFTIKQGDYLAETIHQWHDNIPAIGGAFRALMNDALFDSGYPCVEWYKTNEEMLCMVRVKT